MASSLTSTIQKNDGVLLRKESNLKFVKAIPGRRERMLNFNFYLDNMIGKAFGTAYEVQGNQLVPMNPLKYEIDDVECNGKEEHRDNRRLVDDSGAQKLSRDEIMKLKSEGIDGQDIIEKIVDSSATFKEKTVYSQAKYLKKKKKKHLAYFTTCKPTSRLLCQLYFTKAPSKVLDIRPDTLAQLLTWSDVRHGSRVLVTETCQGLILGSVLERMGNRGMIIQGYNGNCPVRIILNQFNFSDEQMSKQVCGFSFESLEDIKDKRFSLHKNESKEMASIEEKEKPNVGRSNNEGNDEKPGDINYIHEDPATVENSNQNSNPKNSDNIPCNKFYTKEKRESEQKCAMHYLADNCLDALIIATKFHPLNVLINMIGFIKSSAPIVIYCQHKEPLMECYTYLRDASLAINVHLTETWFREMQVLQDRTHPEITMSGRSGYLLRGLKLKSEDGNEFEPKPKAQKF